LGLIFSSPGFAVFLSLSKSPGNLNNLQRISHLPAYNTLLIDDFKPPLSKKIELLMKRSIAKIILLRPVLTTNIQFQNILTKTSNLYTPGTVRSNSTHTTTKKGTLSLCHRYKQCRTQPTLPPVGRLDFIP
jgi:hypothetical protein